MPAYRSMVDNPPMTQCELRSLQHDKTPHSPGKDIFGDGVQDSLKKRASGEQNNDIK
jgi:hypothetical protein